MATEKGRPADLRKGYDGLYGIVTDAMGCDVLGATCSPPEGEGRRSSRTGLAPAIEPLVVANPAANVMRPSMKAS
jgi:hypothetical protein